MVLGEQRIPVAAPDDLDDVPAGAVEGGIELLDDFAVAAHGSVEPLQVAVDDEDEVVEEFARSEGEGAQRFGLVGFAVANEAPDAPLRGVGDAAIVQIVEEAGVIDRHDWAEAHGDGGELPEVGHEPGMRVRRQAAAVGELASEVAELGHGQPPFEKRTGIDARRAVSLKVDEVAAAGGVGAAEKMVEADFVEGGEGSVRRNVPTDAVLFLVGPDDHGHSIPACEALDASLHIAIAGEFGLALDRYGIDVGRGERSGHVNAIALRLAPQLVEQITGAVRPLRS